MRRWPVFLYKLTNADRLDSERMLPCRSESELEKAKREGWKPHDEFYDRLRGLQAR